MLDPTANVEGRPFTDPAWTRSDAEVMRTMLLRERAVAHSLQREGPSGVFVRDLAQSGRREWLAVPDSAALVRARDVTAIGFFGQSRPESDHTILFELENEVAESFPAYAASGLLSYYDMELADGSYGYGNLILFSTADVPKEWYTNAAHERAVAISPQHYRSVRLHKGSIPGPFLGDGDLTIGRTKYLDFASDPIWRALRVFVSAG
jgi:hypothetical protein